MSTANFVHTPVEDIPKIHARVVTGFQSGKLKDIEYRKYQLLQLLYLFKDNEKRWEEAMAADLGRPTFEAHFFELRSILVDILEAHSHVAKWAKPESPPFNINFFAMRPRIRKEPKGAVLIMGAFNYPVWLVIGPLASAIAAGCAGVIKPSEQTPVCSALLAELFPKYMDPELFQVVNGAIPETTALINLRWGHLLYTGSGRVGKIIATAAAQTFTPVTLELGGKSPVFIDPKTDLSIAARRILWGKAVNAGQTCVAPDYVLVPREVQDKLVEELKLAYNKFYPDAAPISQPGNYARIVTPQAFSRLSKLLDTTQGKVVIGGERDEATKFMDVAIVKDVSFQDSLMSEEIFGPVLPLVPVDSLEEGLKYVNANDPPLALYAFSSSAEYKEKVFSNTQSGSAVANEQLIQIGVPGLPFGGAGPSGHSGYHTGKFGFDLFTHTRSTMDSPSWIDTMLGFRYPPYTTTSMKKLYQLGPGRFPARPKGPPGPTTSSSKWWLFALALAIAGGLTTRFRLIENLRK